MISIGGPHAGTASVPLCGVIYFSCMNFKIQYVDICDSFAHLALNFLQ
jgi:hypothetical protein